MIDGGVGIRCYSFIIHIVILCAALIACGGFSPRIESSEPFVNRKRVTHAAA